MRCWVTAHHAQFREARLGHLGCYEGSSDLQSEIELSIQSVCRVASSSQATRTVLSGILPAIPCIRIGKRIPGLHCWGSTTEMAHGAGPLFRTGEFMERTGLTLR